MAATDTGSVVAPICGRRQPDTVVTGAGRSSTGADRDDGNGTEDRERGERRGATSPLSRTMSRERRPPPRSFGGSRRVDWIVEAMVVAGLRRPSSSPSRRWRRPGSACSRTRSSRTTSPPSSFTTTSRTSARSEVIEKDPRAQHRVRGGADRRRPRPSADHQPDIHRAVQGDRRREDAQRDDLQALGAPRTARCARSRSS